MTNISYWQRSLAGASFATLPALDCDEEADVVVVGGGLTGLTTAYLLANSGKRIILIERDVCAAKDTAWTTAHLTFVTDTRFAVLARRFGDDGARLVWEAGRRAIAEIEEIVRNERIDCHFRRIPGYLTEPIRETGGDQAKELQKDCELAAALGFDCGMVSNAPFFHRPGIEFPGQATFHPLRYLSGIQRALLTKPHVRLFEHTNVDEIADAAGMVEIRCRNHTVRASKVIICTHVPIMGKTSLLRATIFQTKLAPYTSYVIGGRAPAGTLDDVLVWDTTDPYYYLRLARGDQFDEVIFGGRDDKTGQHDDAELSFTELEEELRRLVPSISVSERWSGQVIETSDGVPYIGEIAENQFLTTGYCGNGITFGTIGAVMAREYAHGRTTDWHDLFSPHRSVASALGEYVRENVDFPTYFIRSRMQGEDEHRIASLQPGEGAVVKVAGSRCAVYRTHEGELLARSAVCTHLGCVVRWNSAEQSWDCPCHGSPFGPDGQVISGPAEEPLPPVALPSTSSAGTGISETQQVTHASESALRK